MIPRDALTSAEKIERRMALAQFAFGCIALGWILARGVMESATP